ncbi:MAG TPA: Gfo/Idh/MocA family oxidoreductase, partial [Clostridiales bacterium]|nr:Gfo/Idh/MocA family oxidoreductase [Clostridiales bacterium]
MKRLKVGIVGIGGIGKGVHLTGWSQNPNTEVIALCDIRLQRAQEAAEQYHIKHVFENYEDMLAMDEIDIIDICTPNYLHSKIAVKAMEKGKHVFCEKPDAISPEEALKMKEASEKSGKMLMVMRNNRFADFAQYLKKYIEDGNLGEIYAAKCGWIRRRGIPGKGGWFTTKAQSGGGPLIDLGVHMIDLA